MELGLLEESEDGELDHVVKHIGSIYRLQAFHALGALTWPRSAREALRALGLPLGCSAYSTLRSLLRLAAPQPWHALGCSAYGTSRSLLRLAAAQPWHALRCSAWRLRSVEGAVGVSVALAFTR
jgi:hypothetical protein